MPPFTTFVELPSTLDSLATAYVSSKSRGPHRLGERCAKRSTAAPGGPAVGFGAQLRCRSSGDKAGELDGMQRASAKDSELMCHRTGRQKERPRKSGIAWSRGVGSPINMNRRTGVKRFWQPLCWRETDELCDPK